MKFCFKILGAALLLMLLFSCSTEKKEASITEKVKVTNPNGDSELALAMRKIFDQTEEIKKSLNEGALIIPDEYIENLRKFHTAKPTDPEVKVEQFFGFVKAIDIAAQELEKTNDFDTQKEQYSRVINACVQCHQEFCPGPIRRINKLKLPKN